MTEDQKDRRPFDILWSDRAKVDLGEIGDYIAADSPIAAKRWVDRLSSDVERAAEMPFSGRRVPEFAARDDIREVLRHTYRIVYAVGDTTINVLTIFEGHRLFPSDVVPKSESS